MITYFPRIYPDELIYSALSRISAKSGYISYTQAIEEFFENPNKVPDVLFVNKLKKEVVNLFCRNEPWEQIVEKHTMIPYYSRFMDANKKRDMFLQIKNTEVDYSHLLAIPYAKEGGRKKQFLRYCPLCIKEHRKKYGETYWSRMHQIPEISACPIHGCKLKNGSVCIDKHLIKRFAILETEVLDLEVEYNTELEFQLAKYMNEFMQMKYSIEQDCKYSNCLLVKLRDAGYSSARRNIVAIEQLREDMISYYGELNIDLKGAHIFSKNIQGIRHDVWEIVLLGFFLNIPAIELVNHKEQKNPAQEFEEEVLMLLSKGLNNRMIAEKLGVSKSTVRLVAGNNGVKNRRSERYVTRFDANKEDSIRIGRELWIQEMEKYSGLSYSKICEKSEYGARLQWLRKYDNEWTSKHFPVKTKKFKS